MKVVKDYRLSSPMTRRSFLGRAKFLAAAITVGAGSGVMSMALEAAVIEYLDIPLERLSYAFEGFRIVQLSDFHYDPLIDGLIIRCAVAKTNELNPPTSIGAPPLSLRLNVRRTAVTFTPEQITHCYQCAHRAC